MKKLSIILLLLSNACFAQRTKLIDSLIADAKASFYSDFNKTISLSNRIIKLSADINDLSRKGTGYNLKGIGYQFKGDIDSALIALQSARTIAVAAKDQLLLGKISANMGATYFRLAKYDKALSYGYEGLKIMEKLKDTIGISRMSADLANALGAMNQYYKSITYLKRSIYLATKVGDIPSTGNFYNSMGVAYNHLGKLKDAGAAFKKAMIIFKQNNNIKGQLTTLVNLAQLNILLNRPNSLTDLLAGEKIAAQLEDKQRGGELNILIAKQYRREGNYPEALKYINRGIA